MSNFPFDFVADPSSIHVWSLANRNVDEPDNVDFKFADNHRHISIIESVRPSVSNKLTIASPCLALIGLAGVVAAATVAVKHRKN